MRRAHAYALTFPNPTRLHVHVSVSSSLTLLHSSTQFSPNIWRPSTKILSLSWFRVFKYHYLSLFLYLSARSVKDRQRSKQTCPTTLKWQLVFWPMNGDKTLNKNTTFFFSKNRCCIFDLWCSDLFWSLISWFGWFGLVGFGLVRFGSVRFGLLWFLFRFWFGLAYFLFWFGLV